jgi:hypothetical protein
VHPSPTIARTGTRHSQPPQGSDRRRTNREVDLVAIPIRQGLDWPPIDAALELAASKRPKRTSVLTHVGALARRDRLARGTAEGEGHADEDPASTTPDCGATTTSASSHALSPANI